jgi:hypothetical protein
MSDLSLLEQDSLNGYYINLRNSDHDVPEYFK